ncbi:MAG: ECF transporter S component [Clostridiales bacterium]|nr:ECF transporter S component [Clostridiales bacterium]
MGAKVITRVAVLGAIATVLFWIPGIPIILPFYKLDFSNVPVLMAGYAMGPVPALVVLLIKDLTGLLFSSSAGVGELADFLCSAAFVVPGAILYQRHRTFKGALIGMAIGIPAIAIVGALSNYYILIPAFLGGQPIESLLGWIQSMIPAIDSLIKLIFVATIPFNLIKGVALSAITLLLYKRISPLLKP